MSGLQRRRALPTAVRSRPTDPLAAWHAWVADHMQQRERDLSPFDATRPSALILVPLLGLPALVVVGFVVALLLR